MVGAVRRDTLRYYATPIGSGMARHHVSWLYTSLIDAGCSHELAAKWIRMVDSARTDAATRSTARRYHSAY